MKAMASIDCNQTMNVWKLHYFNHLPTTVAQSGLRSNEIDSRPFPWKLFNMLETASELGLHHTLSWTPDGKSFAIWDREKFMSQVVPLFFKQSKFRSFVSQHNAVRLIKISLLDTFLLNAFFSTL